jgi:hypothetical protein
MAMGHRFFVETEPQCIHVQSGSAKDDLRRLLWEGISRQGTSMEGAHPQGELVLS